MNAAVNAALIAAAAKKEEARKAVLNQFRDAEAFGPASAIAPDAGEPEQAAALDDMLGLGIVRPAGNGRYYLDREREKEREQELGRISLLVIVGTLSIIASAVALIALT